MSGSNRLMISAADGAPIPVCSICYGDWRDGNHDPEDDEDLA